MVRSYQTVAPYFSRFFGRINVMEQGKINISSWNVRTVTSWNKRVISTLIHSTSCSIVVHHLSVNNWKKINFD